MVVVDADGRTLRIVLPVTMVVVISAIIAGTPNARY